MKIFVLKFLFCNHYSSPLNTFMREKEPDPDPYLWLTAADPDPEHCRQQIFYSFIDG
jgi:hypothetical protein